MAATVEQQISSLNLKDKVDNTPPPPPQPTPEAKKSEKEEKPKENESKKEEEEEAAILTNILPEEDFVCCLGEECFLKDPKSKEGKMFFSF